MKFKRICCVVMAALMMISGMTVYATKASEIQSQKTQNEKALKDVQSKITHILGCEQQFHVAGLTGFIQILDPCLHGSILLILCGFCRLIIFLCLFNLHFFVCQIALQHFNIQ